MNPEDSGAASAASQFAAWGTREGPGAREGGASAVIGEDGGVGGGDTREAAYGRMQALLAQSNSTPPAQPDAEQPSAASAPHTLYRILYTPYTLYRSITRLCWPHMWT